MEGEATLAGPICLDLDLRIRIRIWGKKLIQTQTQIQAKKQIHNPTQPMHKIESKTESKSIRFHRFETRPNPWTILNPIPYPNP